MLTDVARNHFPRTAGWFKMGASELEVWLTMRTIVSGLPVALLGLALAAAGCVSPVAVNPPIVNVTPFGVGKRPAKLGGCPMPVLDTMPLQRHEQLALIDAWGDLASTDSDLLALVKREGCQLGADAVVLNSQQTQHEGDLIIGAAPGRFGNIGPGSEANITQGTHIGIDPQGGGHKHHAVVGEEGHPGRFFSSIAIVYTAERGSSDSSAQNN